MEKQREKAAQRLQRKQQRQTLPSEDALALMDGPDVGDPDEHGDTTPGENNPVAG